METSDASARRGLVIVGAGGFGREVLQYAYDVGSVDRSLYVKGFLDDTVTDLTAFGLDVVVLGDTRSYHPTSSDRLVIAVGEPSLRAALARRFEERGAVFATIVHPLAYVSAAARVGVGCVVAPFATVGAAARRDEVFVGSHAVVNPLKSVGDRSKVAAGSVVYRSVPPDSIASGNPAKARPLWHGIQGAGSAE
ncbi:MAG: hypothetical protein LC667_01430 [Thioalkalivibrio sp.]|nr:hypothetical protein [Thioalkalivibrio sp.]